MNEFFEPITMTRWLLLLTMLASVGWVAVTSYHFRADLNLNLRLLWENRSQVAGEYLPALSGMVEPPPDAVPVEDILRARVPRPVPGQVWIADVLVGNAVRQLKEIGPLVVLPALVLFLAGFAPYAATAQPRPLEGLDCFCEGFHRSKTRLPRVRLPRSPDRLLPRSRRVRLSFRSRPDYQELSQRRTRLRTGAGSNRT